MWTAYPHSARVHLLHSLCLPSPLLCHATFNLWPNSMCVSVTRMMIIWLMMNSWWCFSSRFVTYSSGSVFYGYFVQSWGACIYCYGWVRGEQDACRYSCLLYRDYVTVGMMSNHRLTQSHTGAAASCTYHRYLTPVSCALMLRFILISQDMMKPQSTSHGWPSTCGISRSHCYRKSSNPMCVRIDLDVRFIHSLTAEWGHLLCRSWSRTFDVSFMDDLGPVSL